MSVLKLSKALIGVAALICSFASAASISGKVVGVADGDTITVLDDQSRQHKVRLDGIDAPEKVQPFGQRSKRSLSEMVFGKVVVVETHKQNHYGRSVGKVIHQGRDVNLEQVRRGLAWHYKAYEREQAPEDILSYAKAEEDARGAKLGIWNQPDPVAPWDWRKKQRGVR